jgi:small subunit ribosomal protein S16
MALKIRLARGGAKKRPFYRIVIAEATAPRDGRFIERIGSYNPILGKDNPERIVLDEERAKHWLSVGARRRTIPKRPSPARRPSSAPKRSARRPRKARAKPALKAPPPRQCRLFAGQCGTDRRQVRI